MECYDDSYAQNKAKREVFDRYNYLKDKECCDAASCQKYAQDIESTRFLCNKVFGSMHERDAAGNIMADTLCGELSRMKTAAEEKTFGAEEAPAEEEKGTQEGGRRRRHRRTYRRRTRRHRRTRRQRQRRHYRRQQQRG